ncbi:MAG: CCA tRNA nucleotidyltransferase [Lachnospiraceae bacterium]|nr:CCA tRNA nucleotidyltransferase [Lachnospiraceae bacterium]
MYRIAMPWEVEWIIERIRAHGFEAFAVGGCVRDMILGREPGDWDITTSAEPARIKQIFTKTIDTGLKHGTVTVLKNHQGYEVTTYRIDGEYQDGRHPDSVEFTADLTEDLKRRDFTINAMAYSHETGVVDRFNGITDLYDRVIRCVGLAQDRFQEDALRILRAIRFSAQLGFSIEEATWQAVCELANSLSKVSKERVQTELTKLLLSAHPDKILLVEKAGLAEFVTDGFAEVFVRAREGAGEEPFGMLYRLPQEKSMRWAGFLRYMTPAESVKILKGLKLDNETIDNVRVMTGGFQSPIAPEKIEIRRMLSRMTPGQFEGILHLKAMDKDEDVHFIRKLWKEILADGDCVCMKDLAVSGGDLLAIGMQPGRGLGEALGFLFEQVIANPKLNQKELLLERLGEWR